MSDETKRVLVVDDDELLREFYSRVLAGQGYEAVCAANGDEAIRLLEGAKEDFALVIMDLLMPVRTGWELIEYIKAAPAWQKVPILAITGLAASFEEFERVKAVCDEVLLKGDFELARFCDTVKRLSQKHSRA
jgi:CheY-like chemotaxis protein